MSECARCGAEIRWVTVEDGQKIPLDARPTYNGEYALHPEDVERAVRIGRPGLYGHNNHDETCRQPVR